MQLSAAPGRNGDIGWFDSCQTLPIHGFVHSGQMVSMKIQFLRKKAFSEQKADLIPVGEFAQKQIVVFMGRENSPCCALVRD